MNTLETTLNHIPPPAEKRLAIRVTKAAERMLRRGHPWLYDQAITSQSGEGTSGDLAVVFDHKKKFLAIGLYDPHSPIRVRILHQGKAAKIDRDWFKGVMTVAVARREPLLAAETTGYRLVYGEGDGLPGLIIDRYSDTIVVKLYSAVWFPYLASLLSFVQELIPIKRIVLRLSRHLQGDSAICHGLVEGQILEGEEANGDVLFVENGLQFAADVIQGHKTGFFFDHRDNRQRVRQLAKSRRVLDLFAYSGGFSLYAAAGGAKEVVSIDVSRPALQAAENNFRLNQTLPAVAQCRHETRVGDVFEQLKELQQEGERFGLIVIDPPSFAKSQKEVDRAFQQYARLTQMALSLLAPAGILVSASCSSRIQADDFFRLVLGAADEAERPLWEQFRTGHALDHPVRESFPEGEYLKCLFASTID